MSQWNDEPVYLKAVYCALWVGAMCSIASLSVVAYVGYKLVTFIGRM